ncbi:MAG: hypothetical protein GY708_16425 [Actinomycetia bacterium]|nr:hypothetical protein [Actinomycetes bacterium]MCP4962839.1 hypothetical protein [Actinomycetes bacterium]
MAAEFAQNVPPHLDSDAVKVVLDRAHPIASRLIEEGHRVFVVGGLVRDLHLGGGPSADVDMTTDAKPAAIKEAVAPIAEDVWSQGERFGTIGCSYENVEYEITTHRADAYEPDSRKPRVEFSSAISSDLSRRDFTVNAMAIEVPDGRLIDPFDGAGDLALLRLRTPIDATTSFSDDPLRVLRAARFIARYGLIPDDELVEAAASLAHRLEIVSAERIRDEFEKLLATDRPGAGLRFLSHIGALGHVFPELGRVSFDLDALVERLDRVPARAGADRSAARRAIVVHQALGGQNKQAISTRLHGLRYSRSEQKRTVSVAQYLAALLGDPQVEAPSARRIYAALGDEWSTVAAAVAGWGETALVESLASTIANLDEKEDLTDLGPELSGEVVMGLLGITSGRQVGDALRQLVEWRLDEGPHDPAELEPRLSAWFEGR